MKKILLLCVIVCQFLSCKKEEKTDPSFPLEYKISPLDSYITKIEYKDQTGTSVETTNLSTFPGGIKTITVPSKPFSAQLTIEVNNTTTSTLNYTLTISVYGVPQKTVSLPAPAMTASTKIKAEVDFN